MNQDQFSHKDAKAQGIVQLADIPTIQEEYGSHHPFADKLSLWQGDITRLEVDAIVNAANAGMLGCFIPGHNCIDNVIHRMAGIELKNACEEYMISQTKEYGPGYTEPTGRAVLTPGFNLPAKHVMHTVGPIVGWELTESLKSDLRNCYKSCLNVAMKAGIRSIAFCCISTGEFHFPNDEAARIAVDTVKDFLLYTRNINPFDRIIFNVFKDVDLECYQRILI